MWRKLYAEYLRREGKKPLLELAPQKCFPRIKELGDRALKAERFQDAVDVYSFALCYKFDASTLAARAEAYWKLKKFRMTYIDACEALKIDKRLAKAWYHKALALEAMGHCALAVEAMRQYVECENPKDDTTTKLMQEWSAKAAEKKAPSTASLVYNPLEADSPQFGRELLLGELNRYLLNGRKPVSRKAQKKFKFDQHSWMSIPQMMDYAKGSTTEFLNRNQQHLEAGERLKSSSYESVLELAIIRLVWTTECLDLLILAIASIGLKRFYLAYINASEAYKMALKRGLLAEMEQASCTATEALMEMGFYVRARKAIEPAARIRCKFSSRTDYFLETLQYLSTDVGVLKASALDEYDPLDGEGFLYELRRRTQQAMRVAIGKLSELKAQLPPVDGDENPPQEGPFTDTEVDAIFTETKRAINDGRFHDARLLYTILINGHKRTPRALVGRAATTLFGGFSALSGYIDAREALNVDPTFLDGYKCLVKALIDLGCFSRARAVISDFLRLELPKDVEWLNEMMAQVWGQDDILDAPVRLLEGYDTSEPDVCTLVSNADDPNSVVQSNILCELRAVEEAKEFMKQKRYDEAVEKLTKALRMLPTPARLTLRAECYFALGEHVKAFLDASAAVGINRHFHDAVEIGSYVLIELGWYSMARNWLENIVKCLPHNDKARLQQKRIKNKKDEPKVELRELWLPGERAAFFELEANE